MYLCIYIYIYIYIQVGFAQSAALKKLANRNVFRQHRSFSFRSRFCTNIFFTFWYISVPGVPPEPSQGCQSEAQWWQVCPDPLFHRFHRFWDPFWEAFSNMLLCLRHPVSECFFGGVQRRTCKDFGFVLGAFSEAFPVCFQE